MTDADHGPANPWTFPRAIRAKEDFLRQRQAAVLGENGVDTNLSHIANPELLLATDRLIELTLEMARNGSVPTGLASAQEAFLNSWKANATDEQIEAWRKV